MARKKITHTAPNATPRHLWLAGLGLAVIAKRQTAATAAQAIDRAAQTRRQAIAAVGQAQSKLIETAGEVRGQIENGVAQAGRNLESALAPLVARLKSVKGKPAKAKRVVRRGRKPGTKNVRRTVKKVTAKRARKA